LKLNKNECSKFKVYKSTLYICFVCDDYHRATTANDIRVFAQNANGTSQYGHQFFHPVIQDVADPRRNGRIGKVFELAELRFRRDIERDFRI